MFSFLPLLMHAEEHYILGFISCVLIQKHFLKIASALISCASNNNKQHLI